MTTTRIHLEDPSRVGWTVCGRLVSGRAFRATTYYDSADCESCRRTHKSRAAEAVDGYAPPRPGDPESDRSTVRKRRSVDRVMREREAANRLTSLVRSIEQLWGEGEWPRVLRAWPDEGYYRAVCDLSDAGWAKWLGYLPEEDHERANFIRNLPRRRRDRELMGISDRPDKSQKRHMIFGPRPAERVRAYSDEEYYLYVRYMRDEEWAEWLALLPAEDRDRAERVRALPRRKKDRERMGIG